MKLAKKIQCWLGSLFSKSKFNADMDAEMQLHLQLRIEKYMAGGMTQEEARYAALRGFGSIDQIKERVRDEHFSRWIEDGWRDVRHSVRSLARERAFTMTVLIIFALCFGANVVIFSMVNGVLLRPLPFRDPGRLVSVYDSYPKAGLVDGGVSPFHYLERKAQVTAFEATAAWYHWTVTLGGADRPESIDLMEVTPSFFRLLGVDAALGRTFSEDDGSEGKTNVTILSDDLWRSRFNSDPAILGRTVIIDAVRVVVVGVMRPGFHFLSHPAKAWMPLRFTSDALKPELRYTTGMGMVGRLRPSITMGEMQAQVDAINSHTVEGDVLAKQVHEMGYHTIIHGLHADYVSGFKPTLLLLQAGVLCLLLIGAVNLSNLVLLRASGRAKEFSVRRALGANWFRLARTLTVETLLLSFVGGLLGLGLGAASLRGVTLLVAEKLPIDALPTFDPTTCFAELGASFLVGLLLSVPAILQTLRGNLTTTLALESRSGTTTRAVNRLRHTLIVVQIALAFVLLTATCLLGLSFARVLGVNPGFHSENVLTGTVALPWTNYQEPKQRLSFVERLITSLRIEPGVLSVGICTRVPFGGSDTNDYTPFMIEGRVLSPDDQAAVHYFRVVEGDYFATLGVPLLKGRFLTNNDSLQANKMCLIDDTMARRYWPEGDALGHRITCVLNNPKREDYFTIVGIVGSVKQNGLDDQNVYGVVYCPNALFSTLGFTVAVRTTQAPEAAASALRTAVLRIDPELPVTDLKTMAMRVSDSLAGRRIPLLLAGIFAGVALVLAATGIYGVLAYQVSQRRREIGVRMALGARPEQILHQFLGLGFGLLAGGLPLGMVGAWLASRLMADLLFGVSPMNPLVIAGTALLLGGVAMLACWLPSRRASQVAPAEALR